MKVTQLFEARFEPNAYFSVVTPTEVWLMTGYAPSNYYYGTSQMFRAVYEPIKLKVGDELHWLHGGLFVVRKGKDQGDTIRLTPPSDASPFERGGTADPRQRRLNELIGAGAIKQLTASNARRVEKYVTPE